jgi:hypothetical protein
MCVACFKLIKLGTLRCPFCTSWQRTPEEVRTPDLQYVRCCHADCPGLVAKDGTCTKCGQKFAALIICPKCGWKQGVLNADKFHFKCWQCESEVADS